MGGLCVCMCVFVCMFEFMCVWVVMYDLCVHLKEHVLSLTPQNLV